MTTTTKLEDWMQPIRPTLHGPRQQQILSLFELAHTAGQPLLRQSNIHAGLIHKYGTSCKGISGHLKSLMLKGHIKRVSCGLYTLLIRSS